MENLFPKWKINFANGKFYFPNGKSISRMENLFPKWKINFPNGKFISQMENQFPKREILFQTSPAGPPPQKKIFFQKL